MGLLAVAFAVLVAFADPVEQSYAYPLLALVAIGGFAVVVRRSVAPVVLATAFVLTFLPTAGPAGWLGRDIDARAAGACTAPLAAPFVADPGLGGWTEYAPIPSANEPVTGEIKLTPTTIGTYSYTTSFSTAVAATCGRRAGQRLATALGLVVLGAILWTTSSRRPSADFRVRR